MKGVWDIYCASRALQMDGSGVLGVLRGPTKQLVSSALVGACGVSGIEYALDGRAHCLVYRSPYDDEVLYGAASRREAYYRPVGLAAIQMIASPYSVGLTLVRNMSLSCLSVAHSHILLLTEAEERAIEKGVDAEDVPFPWEEVPKACLPRSYPLSLPDCCVTSSHFTHAVNANCGTALHQGMMIDH